MNQTLNSQSEAVAAVVLAGGFGTRIRHLLGDLPKPLAPVADKPFLDWVLRYLIGQRVTRLMLSTGYLGDMIERHYHDTPVPGATIVCRREVEPMGTAGGFLHTIEGVEAAPSVWLVCNGDSLVLAPLAPLFQPLLDGICDAGILAVPMNDAARYGTVEKDEAGLLVAFHEKRPGAGLINAGVYAFRSEVIARFPQRQGLSFERDVFPHLLAEGARIGVCVAPEAPFIDIGVPETLDRATEFIDTHREILAGFN